MPKLARKHYCILGASCCLAALYVVLLLKGKAGASLAREDSFVEDAGAASFFVASIFFLLAYYRSRSPVALLRLGKLKLKRNAFYLLLGAVFLFGFLEEVSWGQRIFGFDTPGFFLKYNRQKEFNIHNLRWFHGRDEQQKEKGFVGKLSNMDRLFSVFWFTFCFCAPLAHRASRRARMVLDRVRLPIVPLAFGVLFVLNYVVSKLIALDPRLSTHAIVEVKETNFAFLFLCVAVNEAHRLGKARKEAERADGPRPATGPPSGARIGEDGKG